MFKGVKRVLCVGIDKRCSYAFLLILYGFLLSTKMTTPEMMIPLKMNRSFILANLLGLGEKLPPGIMGQTTYHQMSLTDLFGDG